MIQTGQQPSQLFSQQELKKLKDENMYLRIKVEKLEANLKPSEITLINRQLYLDYMSEVLEKKENELIVLEGKLEAIEKKLNQEYMNKKVISLVSESSEIGMALERINRIKVVSENYETQRSVESGDEFVGLKQKDRQFWRDFFQSDKEIIQKCLENQHKTEALIKAEYEQLLKQRKQLATSAEKFQELSSYEKYLNGLQKILEEKQKQIIDWQERALSHTLEEESAEKNIPNSMSFGNKSNSMESSEAKRRKQTKAQQSSATNRDSFMKPSVMESSRIMTENEFGQSGEDQELAKTVKGQHRVGSGLKLKDNSKNSPYETIHFSTNQVKQGGVNHKQLTTNKKTHHHSSEMSPRQKSCLIYISGRMRQLIRHSKNKRSHRLLMTIRLWKLLSNFSTYPNYTNNTSNRFSSTTENRVSNENWQNWQLSTNPNPNSKLNQESEIFNHNGNHYLQQENISFPFINLSSAEINPSQLSNDQKSYFETLIAHVKYCSKKNDRKMLLKSILTNKARKQRLIFHFYFKKYQINTRKVYLMEQKRSKQGFLSEDNKTTTLPPQGCNKNVLLDLEAESRLVSCQSSSQVMQQSKIMFQSKNIPLKEHSEREREKRLSRSRNNKVDLNRSKSMRNVNVKVASSKISSSQCKDSRGRDLHFQKNKQNNYGYCACQDDSGINLEKLKQYIKQQQLIEKNLAETCVKTEGVCKLFNCLDGHYRRDQLKVLWAVGDCKNQERMNELERVINGYEFKWELYMTKCKLALVNNSNKVAHLEETLGYVFGK